MGANMGNRAAIYLRVSTDEQTTENQERALREVAARSGHEIVVVYRDEGISGSKGRDKRPGFDAMHKDAPGTGSMLVMARSVGRSTRSFVARSLRLPVRAAQPWHRPVPASAGASHNASRLPANSENAYHPR